MTNDTTDRSIKANEISHYASIGSVRGCCGHKHRSLAAAVDCTLRDHRACNSLNGSGSLTRAYSDRQPYAILQDGESVYLGWDTIERD